MDDTPLNNIAFERICGEVDYRLHKLKKSRSSESFHQFTKHPLSKRLASLELQKLQGGVGPGEGVGVAFEFEHAGEEENGV